MESRQNTDQFSLDNYLHYVRLAGFKPSELSLDLLITLIDHHLLSFKYQNYIIYKSDQVPPAERQIPSLDASYTFNTMKTMKGGYCFQHLELFHAVLLALGFKLERHIAKVFARPLKELTDTTFANLEFSHELVIVHLDKNYIVDVGLGYYCLRKPLVLEEGVVSIGDDQYRLTKINDQWRLDTKKTNEDDWFCLYEFSEFPVNYEGILKAHSNMYTTENELPIRKKFLSGDTTREKRRWAAWFAKGYGIYKSKKNDSAETKEKHFSTFDETKDFITKKFGFSLPD